MSGMVFTYEDGAVNDMVALDWSYRSDERFRLAVSASSFTEPTALIQLLRFNPVDRVRPLSIQTFNHPVQAPNALAFLPNSSCHHPDILASAGDTLRIWRINGPSLNLRSTLNDTGTAAAATHLTTLDWNVAMLQRISTLNSNGICTVWDIVRSTAEMHLFTSAPVHAVQDITWGSPNVLAAAYADGDVKIVDIRGPPARAFTIHRLATGLAYQVAWNYRNPNYLAVTGLHNTVVVLDPRRPGEPTTEMRRHTELVNSLAWDPHSPRRICTAGRDKRAIFSEINPATGRADLLMEYAAAGVVEQLKWSWLQPRCVAFVTENRLLQVVSMAR